MAKLVEELQKDCISPVYSYANLFQKAYFIAKKLEQNDMIEFLKNEIDGYGHNNVPDYRYVNVVYKANGNSRQWMPIIIPVNSRLAQYQHVPVKQSVAEIESYLNLKDDAIICPISAELHTLFEELMPEYSFMDICAHYSKHQYKAFLEKGKRLLIDWSIDLEEKGILGEDYKFTEQEKENAKVMTINNYGSINGSNIIDHMEGSSATINNTTGFDFNAVQILLEQIQSCVKGIGLTPEKEVEMETAIQQAKKGVIEKSTHIVKSTMKKIYEICQTKAANFIAIGIMTQIKQWF